VPFCSNIRQKLQEQKRSQNRRADMMMRRRIEQLNTVNRDSGPSSSQSSQQPNMSVSQSQQQPNMHMAASRQHIPGPSQPHQMHGQNIKPVMNLHQHPNGQMNGPSNMQYQRMFF
jgi:hypothetical protein